jgi:hypothetical protein
METSIAVQVSLKSWYGQVQTAGSFFESLKPEIWYQEVSPGRNTVIYLVGHLINSSDMLLELLNVGERRFKEYEIPFSLQPDKSGTIFPEPAELMKNWHDIHQTLKLAFDAMTDSDWAARHNNMTDDDLLTDPLRNKLNVLQSRSTHIAYHLGQAKLVQTN